MASSSTGKNINQPWLNRYLRARAKCRLIAFHDQLKFCWQYGYKQGKARISQSIKEKESFVCEAVDFDWLLF